MQSNEEPQSTKIIMLFHSLMRAFKHQDCEIKDSLHELTYLQLQTLLIIKKHQKATMGFLADEMNISAASATSLVERLIKNNWLERLYDPSDRRQVHLIIPENKLLALTKAIDQKTERMESMLGKLSTEDRLALQRILEELITISNQTHE